MRAAGIALAAVCVMAGSVRAADRQTLAVLDFKAINTTAEEAKAATGFVANAVIKSKIFIVVERKNIAEILGKQAAELANCTDDACATRIGKLLNAQLMIVGSYSELLGTRNITARIISVETGRVEAAETQKVKDPDELDEAAADLVERLTGSYDPKEDK